MFRPGKNPKESAHADDTADHTPQGSSYGSTSPSPAPPAGGTDYYQSPVQTATTSRAVSESESLARDIKEGTLAGFVGNGTSLTGEATFKGMLRVDGHLSGRVSSGDGTLIVSTNGQVDANVEVAVAQIFGTVNGDITATKRIEMGRVARVIGNIQTPALVIEQGATFEGSCRMQQVRDAQDKQAGKESTASTPAASTPTASTSSSSSLTGASASSPSSSSSSAGASASKDVGKSPASAGVTTASDAVS